MSQERILTAGAGSGTCYFCEANCMYIRHDYTQRTVYDNCPNCGSYHLYDYRKNMLDKHKHIIAGYLYDTNNRTRVDERGCIVHRDINGDILKEMDSSGIVPKTIMQKLERLLLHVYKINDLFGYNHSFKEIPHMKAIAYAQDLREFVEMCRAMGELGWCSGNYNDPLAIAILGTGEPIQSTKVKLSVKGIERAEQLHSTNINSKKVFVAMGFKDDLLKAMDNAIRPACSDCGFDAYLISDKEHNNGITDEIIVAIKTSKFVITDFTYNNCGAYFEAGYAQGHGLEVFRCCNKEWFDGIDEKGIKNRLHFDVNHYNFILWESENDLKSKLKNRIRAIIPDAKLTDDEVLQ